MGATTRPAGDDFVAFGNCIVNRKLYIWRGLQAHIITLFQAFQSGTGRNPMLNHVLGNKFFKEFSPLLIPDLFSLELDNGFIGIG
jgi:hypothetical protein